MANEINLQPQLLNLKLYAGDGAEFRVLCKDSSGAPVDVTGVVNAQIRLQRLTPDPPIAIFSINNVDAYIGVIILSLTGDQTKTLMQDPSVKNGKFVGVWDMQWTPAGRQPRTPIQGQVECVADVTR